MAVSCAAAARGSEGMLARMRGSGDVLADTLRGAVYCVMISTPSTPPESPMHHEKIVLDRRYNSPSTVPPRGTPSLAPIARRAVVPPRLGSLPIMRMLWLARVRNALAYAGLALEAVGAVWALRAVEQPVAVRLVPPLLGYAALLCAYLLTRRAGRAWSRPVSPAVWARIGVRLLETPDLDDAFEPDPGARAKLRRERFR